MAIKKFMQIYCKGQNCYAMVPPIPMVDLAVVVTAARDAGWETVEGEELCPRCQAKRVCAKEGHEWGNLLEAVKIDGYYSPPFRSCVRGCGMAEVEIDGTWTPYRHGMRFMEPGRTSEEAEPPGSIRL